MPAVALIIARSAAFAARHARTSSLAISMRLAADGCFQWGWGSTLVMERWRS
jgi:hypothetical protein